MRPYYPDLEDEFAEVDADTINAVLEEGGKFAKEVIFPLNITGDAEGCTLDKTTHEVTAPKGFKEAYAQYVEGGWPALSCNPEYGGQGLPSDNSKAEQIRRAEILRLRSGLGQWPVCGPRWYG